MTGDTAQAIAAVGYGARVVALDSVRGLTLTPSEPPNPVRTPPPFQVADLCPQQVADRLALAHWPWGHQIVVSSLAGGVGRTTLAGLLATVLTELSFAHIWPPIALAETATRAFSDTAHRWDVLDGDPDDTACTRSGAWVFTDGQVVRRREDFSTIIIDALPGVPSANHTVAVDPRASILLVVRPDQASLAEAADVLVWMHDQHQVDRGRVVVVINHTSTTPVGRRSRAAATALATRCAGVHQLPFHPALGPGRALPSGGDLPVSIRRSIARTALDLWLVATSYAKPPRLR
jgi:hypothetical protein